MDDMKYVKKKVAAIPISKLPALAKKTDVSFGALFKIKYGTTKHPRWDTFQTLLRHFRKEEARA